MSGPATVIAAQWIVPIVPSERVLRQHVCVIADGKITAVLPREEALENYPVADWLELPDHVLLPGLINAHTHAAMTLMRGIADDEPLDVWLNDHVWPTEGRWVSREFVADGTRLAAAEMLRGGTTCFADSYFFPDVAAEVVEAVGMRANIGLPVLEFATPWAASADEYLAKAGQVHRDLSSSGRVTTALAPHAPYTVSDDTFRRVGDMAQRMNLKVHLHLHETRGEVDDALRTDGRRPFARLQSLGLVNDALMAVHMTQLTDDEVVAAAEAGVSVLHCPQSNQKLASGFCRIEALRQAGVNVALGTDGAASNNDLDMFDEMRSAALTGKAVALDAKAVPAHWVLESATLGGARALGMEASLGSVEVGKWADLIAVDLSRPATQPVYDVISQLVFAVSREQVSEVWVQGKRLLRSGELTTIDEGRLLSRIGRWGERIGNGRG